MKRHCYIYIFLSIWTSVFSVKGQDEFTSVQRAWLYRIVMKTPVLKYNWKECFEFNDDSFKIIKYGRVREDFNAITEYQQKFPESLQINFDDIGASTSGLISEVSVKLALWELNEELKKYIYQKEECSDDVYKYLINPIKNAITGKMREKKKRDVVEIVVNPSLPIFKKTELLGIRLKQDVALQKKLLNLWPELVTSYSAARGKYFFLMLAPHNLLKDISFLAAGEGSGTAGMLYEVETTPGDSTIAWYGKGIGLFTYRVKRYKNKLSPTENMEGSMNLLSLKPTSLHIFLWGLNSSYKPLVVIINNNKSYHLFASFINQDLTVDSELEKGLSHIDRINQYEKVKIEAKYEKLERDGSLIEILQKEYAVKEDIEFKLTKLGLEIDSLKENLNWSQTVVDSRKRMIDTYLTVLQNKRVRINNLENKLSDKYSEIAKAEKKLAGMKELLGPNVQSWSKKGNLYFFEDGVVFNSETQDLIFPADREDSLVTIRLISASYTLFGDNMDEVQLCVSVTDALEVLDIPVVEDESVAKSVQQTFYYFPDMFSSHTIVSDSIMNQISRLLSTETLKNSVVLMSIASCGSGNLTNRNVLSYPDRKREFNLPVSPLGEKRKAFVSVALNNDTIFIDAYGMTDEIPTRLSEVDKHVRRKLDVIGTDVKNNKYLSALRALDAIHSIKSYLGEELFKSRMQHISNRFNITPKEFEILKGEICK